MAAARDSAVQIRRASPGWTTTPLQIAVKPGSIWHPGFELCARSIGTCIKGS